MPQAPDNNQENLATIMFRFYESLISIGFDKEAALSLTSAYLTALILGATAKGR